MRRRVRKCKAARETAVAEITTELSQGVRTRARSLAMAAVTTRRRTIRKLVADGELKLASSCTQPQSNRRRRFSIAPENSASLADSSNNSTVNTIQMPESSCCSSNSSSELENRSEVETSTHNSNCRSRKETTPFSESEAESGHLTSSPATITRRTTATAAAEMPSESEIEEFFAAAEKDLQKRFAKKYNFDIEKEIPLEGRYEWMPVKQ